MRQVTPPELRFERLIDRRADGHWLWLGATDKDGYGMFCSGSGRAVRAHRWSFEHFVGEIPSGLEIDHLCRIRNCVNPGHLEPVTKTTNAMRADSFAWRNAVKTHCKRGHPLSGPNLYERPKGGRDCRTCRQMHSQLSQARRAAA